MLGIKARGFGFDIGGDWNQKKVSLLEQKEVIEDAFTPTNSRSPENSL